MSRVFTRGYILYLAAMTALLAGVGWWALEVLRAPTLEDLARPDYVDRPDRILRKIDRDGVLHDLRPNTRAESDGIVYETNADGQRDDRDHPVEKSPGRTRILFLGDSFTFGWGLELRHTFVKQLEALLGDQRWEVINLGVPGYGTIMEVGHFEQSGVKYSPDLVILMYHLNDPGGAVDTELGQGEATFRALLGYYQEELDGKERERVEQFLRAKGYPLDPAWNDRSLSWRNRTYLLGHYLPLYWEPTCAALTRLDELARTHGFRVLVGIIPELDHPWGGYPFDDLHARVADEMRTHGFGVLDLKPILMRFPSEKLRLWGSDGHTSAFANRIIAQALYDRLTER